MSNNKQTHPTPPADEITEDRDPICNCPGRRGPTLAWSLAAAISMIAAAMILKFTDISGAAELAVAMSPVPILAGMYWAIFRVVQSVDEMQRKMKLEALGLTVIGSSLIFFTIGQLERIEVYQPGNFGDAWLIITFTYMAAYGLVSLRYRM